MKPRITLTIAGSDSGGGAGIQADLKTFAALEVHGLSVITSITAQNTQGVTGTSDVPAEFVGEQIDAVAEDFKVEWAKTGMVSNSEIIKKIKEKTRDYGIKTVVDPVMVAASGSTLLREDAIQELKNFLGQAKLVTPNIPEANKLANAKIETVEDVEKAAEKIAELGPEGVLIKGGHLDTPEIHNILLNEGELTEFKEPRIPVSDVHGTGCTFSAAITAELVKGRDLKLAIKKAGKFIGNAIRGRLEVGKGVATVNPMAEIWKVTSGRYEVEEVQKAAKLLVREPSFAKLIPEVGTNIAMAPEGAQKKNEVVGLTGRIVKVNGTPHLSGVPSAGGSEHVANIVLTAMREYPQIKAGMNIKFSEEILEKCKKLGLDISEFSRENEPSDVKTMRWGTGRVIEKFGGVPDIIYDRGAVGKEAMIRILGSTPVEVAKTALKIARI